MRRSKLFIAFVISFLVVLCSPAVAAGQGGTVRGRVADSTGVPIAAAVVVLDPGAESVWPDRLPHEITNVSPATKQTEEKIGDRVRLCMVLKWVNEINSQKAFPPLPSPLRPS